MFDYNQEGDPNDKALFKGVRASKFRHVYGEAARKDQCYDNINITKNAHDGNFCAVNPKFLAIVTESCGGGNFIVIPVDKVGRVDVHAGRVTGHKGQIYDIKWNPFNDNVIASCSDDATIKLWYIPDEGLLSRHMNQPLADLREHKRRVSFIEWHPTAENILVSAGADHLVIVWNTRASPEMVRVIDCHRDVIHSLSFNRSGSLLATTCKDKMLRIIDPRTCEVVNEGVCHHGTKASKVIFLGDSQRLFTVGFSRFSDRQWAVWSEKDLSTPLTIENIDCSSGVLFPFWDNDTRMVYVAGKGDGNIRYYETTDEPPYCHYLSQYLSGLPQRGLGVMTKRGCNIYKCEVFRFFKLHAMRPLCEPISMIVPRKSEQFQADIFPNTAAPSPALTAEQWLSGENRDPILFSLKTGAGAKTNKPVFVKTANSMNAYQRPADFAAKFEFISQANQIDYREKLQENANGNESRNQKDCGRYGKYEHAVINGEKQHNGSDSGKYGQSGGSEDESKARAKAESSLGNTFREAISKTTTNGSRSRLPWVKDVAEENEKSIPMCDIVTTKQLPAATFVTLNDDSDDSIATSDDSITDEVVLSNIESAECDQSAGNNSDGSSFANNSPSSNDSLEEKSVSASDLIEVQLSINPRNERELWSAFQEQRALIYKLRSELKQKKNRINQLEELIASTDLK